jgi:hypothetical protein
VRTRSLAGRCRKPSYPAHIRPRPARGAMTPVGTSPGQSHRAGAGGARRKGCACDARGGRHLPATPEGRLSMGIEQREISLDGGRGRCLVAGSDRPLLLHDAGESAAYWREVRPGRGGRPLPGRQHRPRTGPAPPRGGRTPGLGGLRGPGSLRHPGPACPAPSPGHGVLAARMARTSIGATHPSCQWHTAESEDPESVGASLRMIGPSGPSHGASRAAARAGTGRLCSGRRRRAERAGN